ncbi:unnamed protein product [Ilex paraguariensis]|uniref:ditrans,polycis-polyprenyl diphosphate synthase [(2E,6E)-farnesyldiphosphate specific] n=1 Tax=Ilex paraguariensis TaxID=185542 RepID=A0ABC8TSE1_9AQUA
MLKLDWSCIIAAAHLLEFKLMELGDEMQKILLWISQSGNLALCLLWCIIHLIVGIWYFALGIAGALESCLISIGLLKRYKALDIGKVRYLAIVIDSEEARQTSKVIELLRWLAAIGVKNACLYDPDGVLKKFKEAFMTRLGDAQLSEEAAVNDPLLDQKYMALEFASLSDGKEAAARAANLLFVKYYLGGADTKPIFTESLMAEALKAVGCKVTEPDLLLVYGPARCHLGFPAWRLRYTEIVHMGPLKSMKCGSLIKVIRKFTMVRQNYGT